MSAIYQALYDPKSRPEGAWGKDDFGFVIGGSFAGQCGGGPPYTR